MVTLPVHLLGQGGHLSFISCFQGNGSVKSLSLTLTLSSATLIHSNQYDTEAHLGVVCLGLHKTRKCAVFSFILLVFNYLETKEWLCVWCPLLRGCSAASSGWNSIWMHNVGGTKGSVVTWLLWGLPGLRNIMHDPMLVNLRLYWLLDAESSVSKSVTPTSHKGGDTFIRKYHCPFFRWKNSIHLPASGWPVSLKAGTISVLVFIISHSRTQVSHVLASLESLLFSSYVSGWLWCRSAIGYLNSTFWIGLFFFFLSHHDIISKSSGQQILLWSHHILGILSIILVK